MNKICTCAGYCPHILSSSQLWSYRNNIHFQIRSWMESRLMDTQVIKVRVLRKDPCKQLCLIKCRSRTINKKTYRRFIFVEISISNSPEDAIAQFLGSYRLFCFTGISKYGSFNNTFDMIKSLNVLCFCDRKLILLVRTKEVFYVPWQYHEWLKTMEMMRLGMMLTLKENVHYFQPGTTKKIPTQQ